MRQWVSATVMANGIRIHYTRTGRDLPPLILLHGITDNGLCWTRVARALEAEWDVIMPDARGHGLSEAPDTGHDYQTRADDLIDLVGALELKGACVLGHSMGAVTAAVAASQHPLLFSRVILDDPPWRDPAPTIEEERERIAQFSAWTANWIAKLSDMTREQLVDQAKETDPLWHEEEVGPWADSKMQVSLKIAQGGALCPPSWRSVASGIRVPWLLIAGDPESGAIVTPAVAEEVLSLCPKALVARIEGAGHSIQRDRFDAFVAAVVSFLHRQG